MDAQEVLAAIARTPSFVAFCRIVGLRIQNGAALDAFRMLADVGATPVLAHKIVEGWPTPATAKLAGIVTLEIEAAAWLASFIPTFEREPWTALLTRSVRNAAALRDAQAEPPDQPIGGA